MSYIEGGKYQSPAAIGSACTRVESGLVLEPFGFHYQDKLYSYEDLTSVALAGRLSPKQALSITHYLCSQSKASPFISFLSNGVMKFVSVDGLLASYRRHRYDNQGGEKDSFELLDRFVRSQTEINGLPVDPGGVWIYSIPLGVTKPLRWEKRGPRPAKKVRKPKAKEKP